MSKKKKDNDFPAFPGKTLYVFQASDVVIKSNGREITEFRIKRKYGNFKRPVLKFQK